MLAIAPPVESKREFVQVFLEMMSSYSAVVGTPQPGFEVADGLVDPGQKTAGPFGCFLEQRFMVNPKDAPIRVAVERHGIRTNLGAWRNVGGHELADEIPGKDRQVLHPDSTRVIASIFHGDNNDFLRLGTTPRAPLLDAADVDIVQLDDTVQRLALRVDRCPAQTPAQGEGASVRSNPKLALELERRNAWGKSAHEVSRPEPVPDWKMAVLEDRPRGKRDHSSALPTLPVPPSDLPARSAVALGAAKAVRPTNSGKVLQTGVFGGETTLKFIRRPRKHGETPGRAF